MNMSTATNAIALLITIIGYWLPVYGGIIFDTGIFALSGAVTNWLAIYMLFEKVPYLYGSGVIPSRFEEFKAGIKQLIVQEFFTREHIERFFRTNSGASVESIMAKVDFDRVFGHLAEAIEESPLGGMLKMAGGRKALEPLKEPIIVKLKGVIADLVRNPACGGVDGDFTDALIGQLERIIDSRLAELTPDTVKRIIEDMIRQHLGWLVVWGGVFGGAIGIVDNVIKHY